MVPPEPGLGRANKSNFMAAHPHKNPFPFFLIRPGVGKFVPNHANTLVARISFGRAVTVLIAALLLCNVSMKYLGALWVYHDDILSLTVEPLLILQLKGCFECQRSVG